MFDLSWRAIAKVLAAVALVWVWFQLGQFIMVIILSIVMAIALALTVYLLIEWKRTLEWLVAFVPDNLGVLSPSGRHPGFRFAIIRFH